MKKITLFIFLLASVSIVAQAQKKGTKPAPKATVATVTTIKTENDTLSYAFGATLVEQGLEPYLKQMGVISDSLPEAENKKNIEQFLKGVKAYFGSATNAKDPYYKGIAVATQLSQMTASYGQMIGNETAKMDISLFLKGFESALKKEKLLVENAGAMIQEKTMSAQAKVQSKQAEEAKVKYAVNIAEEKAFLAENATKDGIVVLDNGIQYKVITMGNGAKPSVTDKVKVHYHGMLIDGTVFDSSVERGEPITFGLSQVIKGWTEVVQLMPVGSKWTVYIPSELAYGANGAGGDIKPYSMLIFEIELLGIEDISDVQEATPVMAE